MGEPDERSDPLDEAARLFGHALEEWADGATRTGTAALP